MTKSLHLALVAAGRLRDYSVLELRSVRAQLGPVQSASLRQASRIANTIRAGYPVRHVEEFAQSHVILICVPDAKLPRVVSSLADSNLHWTQTAVLVSEGSRGTEALAELAQLGAQTASLTSLNGADKPRFLVEGDRFAVRAARMLVEEGGGRIVEVERGSHGVCAASAAFASWLCQPLMDASAECLRHAGLTPCGAGAIVERAVSRSLRAYLKGGRRAYRAPSTLEERQAFLRQLEALRRRDPALAKFFERTATEALRRMGRSTTWLEASTPNTRRVAAGAGG